jgi:hypothetical protein
MLRNRTILYFGIALIGVLLPPVIVIAALAGPILGLGFIVVGLAGAGAWPVIGAAEHLWRRSRMRSTARRAQGAHIQALDLGVPEVSAIRAPGAAFLAEVVSAEGVCPLLRKKGDIWRLEPDGRLSAPVCSPSAAAISRLMREGAQWSGTTEHCVCPLGKQWVTYMLVAA